MIERSEQIEARNTAMAHLEKVKKEIAKRSKEFVSRRVDSRTIVMARPKFVKEIINQINQD